MRSLLSPDDSPPLDATSFKRIQAIIGDLLYYGRAVDNKLIVALSDLASTQAAATKLYGTKQQFTHSPDARRPLDATGVKRIQAIIGALLYYGRALEKNLLVALIDLASTQAAATELTKTDLSQLIDYLSIYPNDGILYRSSAMILSAHSNAAYLNIPHARSRVSAHIMLSKKTPVPSLN